MNMYLQPDSICFLSTKKANQYLHFDASTKEQRLNVRHHSHNNESAVGLQPKCFSEENIKADYFNIHFKIDLTILIFGIK